MRRLVSTNTHPVTPQARCVEQLAVDKPQDLADAPSETPSCSGFCSRMTSCCGLYADADEKKQLLGAKPVSPPPHSVAAPFRPAKKPLVGQLSTHVPLCLNGLVPEGLQLRH